MVLYISTLPLRGGLLKHRSGCNTSFKRLAQAAGQDGALAAPLHVCSAFPGPEHRTRAGGHGPFHISTSGEVTILENSPSLYTTSWKYYFLIIFRNRLVQDNTFRSNSTSASGLVLQKCVPSVIWIFSGAPKGMQSWTLVEGWEL